MGWNSSVICQQRKLCNIPYIPFFSEVFQRWFRDLSPAPSHGLPRTGVLREEMRAELHFSISKSKPYLTTKCLLVVITTEEIPAHMVHLRTKNIPLCIMANYQEAVLLL